MSVDEGADTSIEGTQNWPELFARIYDEVGADGSPQVRLTDMDIHVPSKTGDDADRAHWTIDGDIELNPDS